MRGARMEHCNWHVESMVDLPFGFDAGRADLRTHYAILCRVLAGSPVVHGQSGGMSARSRQYLSFGNRWPKMPDHSY